MINKILVSVDLSTPDITAKVCEAANDMALKYDAKVQLITILPDYYGTPLVASFFPDGVQDKMKAELREKIKTLASTHFKEDVKVAVIQGAKRVNSILAAIDELSPDLAILGCRRKHSREGQRLLGSTASSVTDRAKCSVLVIRN